MSNFSKRVLSAIFVVPFVYLIIYVGGAAYLILTLALIVLCARELHRLVKVKGVEQSRLVVPTMSIFIALGAWQGYEYGAIALTVSLFGVFIIEVLRGKVVHSMYRLGLSIFGVIYIGWFLSHALLLRKLDSIPGVDAHLSIPLLEKWIYQLSAVEPGFFFVFFVVSCTALNDTFAYFTGKLLGRTKLIPEVSPGKTIKGTVGGVVMSGVCGAVINFLFATPFPAYLALLWGLLIGCTAVLGDLIESLIKRDAGSKDSGRLIPGHGGALDRADSMIFTLPVSYYFLVILEHF
ncbi:MAG: phosphatidate cytidylyltransferase [Candidatus Dadabacteria bacterium]|nr:phosphatidate cytidylyltransferase [Candidatus Dadabacteria bacterium]